jgi:hypothetical protein
MSAPSHRRLAVIRFFFWVGVISTLFYSLCVFAFTIYPHIFAPGVIAIIAEFWGIFGGIYIWFQIMTIVTRPVHQDAWEITDHVTSFIPAAILLFGATLVWWTRGEWPSYDVWKIWFSSLFISMCDVSLTFVSLRISKNATRITSA